MYEELKARIIEVKQNNPSYKAKQIYDIVFLEFETTRKQVSNILQHNKKAIFAPGGLVPEKLDDTLTLPPIPENEEEFSIPLTLYSILHDDFLDNDKKVEILKIMFPDE